MFFSLFAASSPTSFSVTNKITSAPNMPMSALGKLTPAAFSPFSSPLSSAKSAPTDATRCACSRASVARVATDVRACGRASGTTRAVARLRGGTTVFRSSRPNAGTTVPNDAVETRADACGRTPVVRARRIDRAWVFTRAGDASVRASMFKTFTRDCGESHWGPQLVSDEPRRASVVRVLITISCSWTSRPDNRARPCRYPGTIPRRRGEARDGCRFRHRNLSAAPQWLR